LNRSAEWLKARDPDAWHAFARLGVLAEDVPDDGYIRDHLLHHMEQAGRHDALDALLGEETAGQNAWYAVRDGAGQLSGYLADVDRAWRLARADRFAERVLRSALLLASARSSVGQPPPKLLVALVEHGEWTLERALAAARDRHDGISRAWSFVHLLTFAGSRGTC
jgi:hypothetical protein